jgi:hypothetical protein
MTYSAKQAINLSVKWDFKKGEPQPRITPDMRTDFEERAAKALVFHGGNNVVQKYKTHHEANMDDWATLVRDAKKDLQGHFTAEIINAARFEIK